MILSRCVSHQEPLHANGGLGRRESQGSVSSAGSLDLVSPHLPSPTGHTASWSPHAHTPEGSRAGEEPGRWVLLGTETSLGSIWKPGLTQLCFWNPTENRKL